MDIVKSYTYLGIELQASGSFWLAKENLMDKARKTMFPLFSTIAQFHLPVADSLKLFHSMIRPIALYNSENWGIFSLDTIRKMEENPRLFIDQLINSQPDRVLQIFLKYVLGVNLSCTNLATLGEVGEYPLMVHSLTSLLTFWHRISNMPDNALLKQALDMSCNIKYLKTLSGSER